jgi:hypothetical protein
VQLLELGAAISLVIVVGGWMIRKKDAAGNFPP